MSDTPFKSRLVAILAADAAGYSRLMADNERATVAALDAAREVFTRHIKINQGRVVDMAGDSVLAVFGTASGAVLAALAVQREINSTASANAEERSLHFRIGVHLGDVIEKVDGTVYGDGVNIAARLEGLAAPGGVTVSESIRNTVKGKVGAEFADLGEQVVKNIADPVRAYRVLLDIDTSPAACVATSHANDRESSSPPGHPHPSDPTPAIDALLPLPEKPSIAVLPFTNMSTDPEQEYFSDGITEDLITDLSQISGLFVIARNSVFTYKGQAIKVQQVQRELGVRYVLEGSVRKAGQRVRITAQLIDAATGGHVWAQRYDRQLDDIFALQDEVTREIVDALKIKLTKSDEAQMESQVTDNVEAYDLYWRGVAQFNLRTPSGTAVARGLFERAIALDPNYASAHAYLARCYLSEWANRWTRDPRALDLAMGSARKAVALNENLPLAQLALGFVYLWQRQHRQAIVAAERAVELNPNDAEGYAALADILNYAGQPEKAIPLLMTALRLDPHYPVAYLFNLGRAHWLRHDLGEAIKYFERTVTRNPAHLSAHGYLGVAYLESGREEDARREFAAARRLNPDIVEDDHRLLPYRDPSITERIVASTAGMRRGSGSPL